MLNFLIPLLVGVGALILGYMILASMQKTQPNETRDMDDPTASANSPIPYVMGRKTIKGLNVIGFTDKRKQDLEINA